MTRNRRMCLWVGVGALSMLVLFTGACLLWLETQHVPFRDAPTVVKLAIGVSAGLLCCCLLLWGAVSGMENPKTGDTGSKWKPWVLWGLALSIPVALAAASSAPHFIAAFVGYLVLWVLIGPGALALAILAGIGVERAYLNLNLAHRRSVGDTSGPPTKRAELLSWAVGISVAILLVVIFVVVSLRIPRLGKAIDRVTETAHQLYDDP